MGRSTLFVSLRSSSFVENQDGMTSLVPADPRARPTRGRAILRRKHPGHLEADQRPRSFYQFRTVMPARQPARRSCRAGPAFSISNKSLQISTGRTGEGPKRQGEESLDSEQIKSMFLESMLAVRSDMLPIRLQLGDTE